MAQNKFTEYVAKITDLTTNPAQGSEDLRMIHLSEHDSRNVCGHYEASDTGGVNLVFEDVRVERAGENNFKFSMRDLRHDRSIWLFWLSSVQERTGGTTPTHIATYLKTTVEVVVREILPHLAAAQQLTNS